MIVFPAIDLKDGKCVRLKQGKFDDINTYSNNPSEVAKKWESLGAKYIHLVDLDGAVDGIQKNIDTIKDIRNSVSVPIQIGGGIRDEKTIKSLLELGFDRVILGTIAVENHEFLEEMVRKYGDKIAVSIDAKEGLIATKGWTEITEIESISYCKYLEGIGLKTIIYTDISKDGMMQGPNFDIYEEIRKNIKIDVIASGGVSRIEDVLRLNETDIYGCIIGKALYNESINLEELRNI